MAENKQSEIIKTALESVKTILDANTVIGDPITTPAGTTIIPVSKITLGYASGGIDYVKKDTPVANGKPAYSNFGGGGGTGINVTPVAFIVVDSDGNTEIMNMNTPTVVTAEDTVSRIVSLIERSPELIERFKAAFSKNKD